METPPSAFSRCLSSPRFTVSCWLFGFCDYAAPSTSPRLTPSVGNIPHFPRFRRQAFRQPEQLRVSIPRCARYGSWMTRHPTFTASPTRRSLLTYLGSTSSTLLPAFHRIRPTRPVQALSPGRVFPVATTPPLRFANGSAIEAYDLHARMQDTTVAPRMHIFLSPLREDFFIFFPALHLSMLAEISFSR